MNFSKYQLAIFDTVIKTNSNILVDAVPGAGKTTTIVEASKLIPKYKSSIFVAFNKSIVEELTNKLPNNVKCSTIHSLGMTALTKHFKCSLRVSEYKTSNAVTPDIVKAYDVQKQNEMMFKMNILKIIELARMTDCARNIASLTELTNRFNIAALNGEISASLEVMDKLDKNNVRLNKKYSMIDFTDMVVLPTKLNVKLDQYDVVFVDEAQDLNKAQKAFVNRLVKPGGRKIIVGDGKQAIYGFSGSDSEGFYQIADEPNTVQLPLSVCYRCGSDIVQLARQVYPDIQSFEGAKQGVVVRGGSIEDMNDGDMVVCRNTRPLIKMYFDLIAINKKCHLVGKDIATSLQAMVSKVQHLSLAQGIATLHEELDKLESDLLAKGVKKPKNNEKYQSHLENILAIELIGRHCFSMKEIHNKLHLIFNENQGQGINLLSGHRSKGLEANTVYFIEKFEDKKLLPSPYSTQPWQIVQENNLLFVIYTRAKNKLVIMDYK
jgi:superfamily I DNA/RNA helicase